MTRTARRLAVGITFAALALTPAFATAATPGNADAAAACRGDGYQAYVRADNSGFDTVGACVSYAARGGTLYSKSSPDAIRSRTKHNGD